MIIAQEFLPTPFDWRVGIFDRQPLYVCKYHMAHKHWQITNWDSNGNGQDGRVETFLVEERASGRPYRAACREFDW